MQVKIFRVRVLKVCREERRDL